MRKAVLDTLDQPLCQLSVTPVDTDRSRTAEMTDKIMRYEAMIAVLSH